MRFFGVACALGAMIMGWCLTAGPAGAQEWSDGWSRQTTARSQRAQPERREPPRDFFSALFGGGNREERRYEAPPRPSRQSAPARSSGSRTVTYAPSSGERSFIVITPSPGGQSSKPRRRKSSGDGSGSGGRSYSGASGMPSGVSYCVRSCDGRYFPLSSLKGNEKGALAQCNAFCPSANMDVYTSNDGEKGIEAARNKDGKLYTALPTAFTFRQKLVSDCSCRAGSKAVGGMSYADILEDPTLKRGDIVMTDEGARVFAGSKSRPPYRQQDFVAPSKFPELSRSMRKRLEELTLAAR